MIPAYSAGQPSPSLSLPWQVDNQRFDLFHTKTYAKILAVVQDAPSPEGDYLRSIAARRGAPGAV